MGYLIEALGSDRDVASLTRQDARTFRDFLGRRGLKPESASKAISIVAAIVQTALIEYQIGIRNPFHRMHVVNDIAAVDARLPLSREEIAIARSLPVNVQLSTIVDLLALTGARLNEIAGLEWSDVHGLSTDGHDVASITIRTNRIRRLKTANSKRQIPLIAEARKALSGLQEVLPPGGPNDPVFPRYGRSGGSDAASAALMKALRKAGVQDRRKSIHSIRHSMKQALRDVGCPKDIRDSIQGHAKDSIAENYGYGFSMSKMTEWLELATNHLLS
jgi:integrase